VPIKSIARKNKGDVKVKDKAAIVIAALMITSMAVSILSISTTTVSAQVSLTSLAYRGGTRVTLSITVTNDTGENIDNVRFTIVGTPSPTFNSAIGGANTADNLRLAADNILENAVPYITQAGENLIMAEDNKKSSGPNIKAAGDNLEGVTDGRLAAENVLASSAARTGVVANLTNATTALRLVADAIDESVENLDYISTQLTNAGTYLRGASGVGGAATNAENMENICSAVGENLDNAGADLVTAAASLLNGDLETAGGLIKDAGDNLAAVGTGLTQLDLKTAFGNAGSQLQTAGNKLIDAGNFLDNAGYALGLAENHLTRAGVQIYNSSTYLQTAGSNLQIAASLIENAGTAIQNNVLRAGENLKLASDNLENVALEIGVALGGDEATAASVDIGQAAENLRTSGKVGITTAGSELKSVATNLSAAASKMKTTANSLGPSGWSISEVANNVLFSASSSTHIASTASKIFTFFWTTPNVGAIENTYTLRVYVYKPGSTTPTDTWDITLKVDGKAPAATTFTVTQVGVATSNLVGDNLDSGRATITLVTSEVASLGPIYVENSGNGVSLTTSPSVSTTDNLTFTATFTVGTWDDNSCRIRVSATDSVGNTASLTDNFTVDTIAPTFINTGFAGIYPTRANVTQAGTGAIFRYVDNNTAGKQIIGRAEDRATSADNDLWCTVYVNGVQAYKDNNENFFKTITLSQGLNIVTLRAVDRTGNENISPSDNIFVDLTKATASFVSISGLSAAQLVAQDNHISDSTPRFIVTLTDPGYPTTGLGIWRENVKIRLLLDNGSAVYENLDNVIPWTVGGGNWTAEVPTALTDNHYRLEVRVNDNLWDNFMENVVGFYVDTAAPTVPAPGAENPLYYNTTIINPHVQRSATLTLTGTGIGVASDAVTVNAYLNDATTVAATATIRSDGGWTISIPLTEGTTTKVELTMTDIAGNEGSRRFYGYVWADATAPVVTPDELPETTTAASILISGSVTKNTWESYSDITLTLQVGTYVTVPVSVPLDASGNYSYSLALSMGLNTVIVQATDPTLNVSSPVSATIERVPTIDISAPSVTLVGTYPATTTAASITITGTVTKDTVETYSDITVKVQSTLTTREVQAGTDGAFSASVGLAEGLNTITVQAVDKSLNASTITTLTIEKVAPTPDTSAPTVAISKVEAAGVTLTSPYSTDQATVLVTGAVTKDETESYSDITVKVQGGGLTSTVETTPSATGSFSVSVVLVEGSNSITVQAVDQASNTSTATATITRTATPWATYAIVIVIITLVLAAIAIFRKR